MEWKLEVRRKGDRTSLRGSFPYNSPATVKNTGRNRKEVFKPGAFTHSIKRMEAAKSELRKVVASGAKPGSKELHAARVEVSNSNIHVLVGHSYQRNLGDAASGLVELEDDSRALKMRVRLPPRDSMPAYVREAVEAVEAGLLTGISPGFFMPPRGINPAAQRFIPEPGNPAVAIREISDAILVELSLVARAAYSETALSIRAACEYKGSITRPRKRRIWL